LLVFFTARQDTFLISISTHTEITWFNGRGIQISLEPIAWKGMDICQQGISLFDGTVKKPQMFKILFTKKVVLVLLKSPGWPYMEHHCVGR
jgi:hypothetical protein